MHAKELLTSRQSSFFTAGDLHAHIKFFTTGVSSARLVHTKMNFMYELTFHYSYTPEMDASSSDRQQCSCDRDVVTRSISTFVSALR